MPNVVTVTPLAEHMSLLLQLSSEEFDKLIIVSDNARLLSPSAPSPIAVDIATTTRRPLFDKSYSDGGMMMIRKVSPPNSDNTFTKPMMKLSRWNDNDKALAAPSLLPRLPIYRPVTTSASTSTSTCTASSSSTSNSPRACFKRSTSDRSIFQRPPLSMNSNNNSPNSKVTSRWESSSSMTTMTTLGMSSRQRGPEGNSLVLVRQSSDSALVCPVRVSSMSIGASGSLAPSIPERRTSSDSLSSAGHDNITDAMEIECEDDGSDGEE